MNDEMTVNELIMNDVDVEDVLITNDVEVEDEIGTWSDQSENNSQEEFV